MASGVSLNFEQFNSSLDLDGLIQKPWGREYRIYADNFYDIWQLDILPGQSTSMHCHPRKETALLCLEGKARFHTLTESHALETTNFIRIRKGTFHATENVGNSPLKLVEIETPRNKFDLIRAKDKYGRQGHFYEKQTLDCKLTQMEQINSIADAKIRTSCIHNEYRFGIEAGRDIVCRRNLIFIISLGLNQAIAQDIQVFPGTTLPISSLEKDDFYFTIARNL
ncbi:cupin domain-containing protein [Chroococcidiopsis cubana]|nr:cupin domain-containing protein [Chroococcidiopsis cubana]